MPNVSLPSFEAIYIEMFRGNTKLSTGTAFICNSGSKLALISNWHNYSGRNNQTGKCLSPTLAEPNIVRAFLRQRSTPENLIPFDFPLLSQEGYPLWVEHPSFGSNVDVAALPISIEDSVQPFPISWSNPIPLMQRVGLPAKVIGYPFGRRINEHMPVWATGHLASEPDIDVDGLPLMLIDCRTRRGNSGSPVMLHYPQ